MFEKSGMSSGNLKTDKIILNDKGHVKVINALSYPEDQSNTFDSQYSTKLKRFYGMDFIIYSSWGIAGIEGTHW